MNTVVAEGVFWVGYVDWSVRDFHGYVTGRGSTYNAYVVRGEKTALIDTVKAPYAAALLAHVRAVLPEAPDYIICNHAEPDHSGSLPAVLAAFPSATLVCNAKCADALARHYATEGWKFQIVKDGDTLALGGGKTLQFFDTPMVHWPESMATYVVEDAVLFSMDAFGQHYASSARFDDEANLCEVMHEAKTYYANIVLPYGRPVAAALAKLGTLKLSIVCPSHGVIWRSHFADILAAYRAWMVCKPAKKVVILYSTMWQSTRQMAEAIAAGAATRDVEVKLLNLSVTGDTDIVPDVMDCAALAVGSATLNQGIMPRMAQCLTYLRGLKPVGKTGFAFGSFGWASKGAEEAATYLKAMAVTELRPVLTCRFAPDTATLAACHAAGEALADAALKA